MKAFIRKHWLRIVFYGGLLLCAVDGFVIEPHGIKHDRLLLSDHPSVRIVHISDIHHKGDRAYLLRIMADVNRMAPDIVCFTGDIIEDPRYLGEALDALSKINARSTEFPATTNIGVESPSNKPASASGRQAPNGGWDCASHRTRRPPAI